MPFFAIFYKNSVCPFRFLSKVRLGFHTMFPLHFFLLLLFHVFIITGVSDKFLEGHVDI